MKRRYRMGCANSVATYGDRSGLDQVGTKGITVEVVNLDSMFGEEGAVEDNTRRRTCSHRMREREKTVETYQLGSGWYQRLQTLRHHAQTS